MEDIRIIQINESSRYGLLNISMLEAESKRALETKGIRLLLESLFNNEQVELAYRESGKPYLKSHSEHISISHSHDKVAIIVDEKKDTGIDIELIRDKVFAIAHKFLSEAEQADLKGGDREKYLIYWAAKETLFKIHGERNIIFKEHLYIRAFNYNREGGEIETSIILPDNKKSYTLRYQKTGDYVLVYPV